MSGDYRLLFQLHLMHRKLKGASSIAGVSLLAAVAFLTARDCIAADSLTWGNKPWPKIVDIVVQASVTIHGDDFEYSYTLYNSTKNSLPLSGWDIDTRLDPNEHPFSQSDISASHTPEEHVGILNTARYFVPVSVCGPRKWTYGVKYPGSWGVEGLNVFSMLRPGETISGFCVVAREPVGIREFAANGYSHDFFNEPEGYRFHGTIDELTIAVNRGIEYLGKTIAPVPPSEPVTVSTWAVHIGELMRESRRLGWIRSDASLDQTNALLAELQATNVNHLSRTAEKISQFSVRERSAGAFSNEADALLRVNTLYLLRRMGVK